MTPTLFYTSNKKYVLATKQDAIDNAICGGFTQGKSLKQAIKSLSETVEPVIPNTIELYTDTLQPDGEYKYIFTKLITIR